MKFFYFSLAIQMATLPLLGNPVDSLKAIHIGKAFFSKTRLVTNQATTTDGYKVKSASTSGDVAVASTSLTLTAMSATNDTAAPNYYIVTNGDQGYAIVSGTDQVTPILGYSTNGRFDPANIPPALSDYLQWRNREIGYIIKNNLVDSSASLAWDELLGAEAKSSSTSSGEMAPLLSTTWDQGTYYNALCPTNTYTGCVATAMAQIMKYWEYPIKGSGSHIYTHTTYGNLSASFGTTTYNWASMPNTVTSANSAVATLMYHCGVSVEMDYGTTGSSAYIYHSSGPSSQLALSTYFGYSSSISSKFKNDYTEATWVALLKSHLDLKKPILYGGWNNQYQEGHAFVCDGYNADGYFHFNWGWSGYYDGYFLISSLTPSTNDFSYYQVALVNIEPGSKSLAVSPKSSTISPSTSTGTFTIITNSSSSWAITGVPSWITVSSSSGTGMSTISYTTTENTTGASRVDTITVSVTGLTTSKTIIITQLDASTPLPNLIPYAPTGWDDKIIVSKVTNTHTDNTVTADNDIYVDFAYINSGSISASQTFNTQLYIDGSLYATYGSSGLSAGSYSSSSDIAIGKLSAGSHTITIDVDYSNVISESNEPDNSYTKTFTVASGTLPNLVPYTTSGWDDKIVASKAKNTNTNDILTISDSIYVDFALINSGSVSTSGSFYVGLYIDGHSFKTYSIDSLLSGEYITKTDINIGKLSTGTHTLEITLDNTDMVSESTETDNKYTMSFSVMAPNLTPYNPSEWDDKIVVSNAKNTHTDNVIYLNNTIYVDFAITNSGNYHITDTFYFRISVDETVLKTYSASILSTGYYYYITDLNLGTLSAGPHTLKVEADNTSRIAESDELDNSYEKTITVYKSNTTEAAEVSDMTVKAFPNPVFDKLQVSSTLPIETLEIIGLNGMVIEKWEDENGVASVNVSKVPAGMYLLKVKTRNGTVYKRIIKN